MFSCFGLVGFYAPSDQIDEGLDAEEIIQYKDGFGSRIDSCFITRCMEVSTLPVVANV